jgi:hypothetical protein
MAFMMKPENRHQQTTVFLVIEKRIPALLAHCRTEHETIGPVAACSFWKSRPTAQTTGKHSLGVTTSGPQIFRPADQRDETPSSVSSVMALSG